MHLVHTYGPWQEYVTSITIGLPNAASDIFKQRYDQIRQKRYCTKCGQIKIRIPREAVK